MNLNEIAHDMREAALKREENGGIKADSKSLFKHMATEVIEAEEAFFFFDNLSNRTFRFRPFRIVAKTYIVQRRQEIADRNKVYMTLGRFFRDTSETLRFAPVDRYLIFR